MRRSRTCSKPTICSTPTRLPTRSGNWPPTDVQNQEDTGGDIKLIERIVARDQAAVGDLYDRHCRLLFGLILRIIRDRSEAEEVLQEVFVLVWTRAETYNVSLGPPAAWLVRIARNRAIHRLRANALPLRAAEAAPQPEPATSPDAGASRSERQGALAHALPSRAP